VLDVLLSGLAFSFALRLLSWRHLRRQAMPDTTKPAAAAPADHAGSPAPLIVDLGKHARKDVKRLCEGRGKLLDEVSSALDELKAAGKIGPHAQPVVIVVRQRRRKSPLWPLA
jgi:hypothetical protein